MAISKFEWFLRNEEGAGIKYWLPPVNFSHFYNLRYDPDLVILIELRIGFFPPICSILIKSRDPPFLAY